MRVIFLFSLCINAFFCSANSDTAYFYTYGGVGDDYAREIIATSDTGYIVVGSTLGFGAGQSDIYLIKTDRNCNKQWSHIYGGSNIEWGYGVRQTYDGGYIVVGFTNENAFNGYDIYLLKVDANGNQQWQKTIGGTDWDFGYGIELTTDSGFIICGRTYSSSNGGSDAYLVKTDSLGNVLWQKNYGGAGDESMNAIIIDRQANFLAIGETTSYGAGDHDMYFIKISGDGDTIWTKSYGGSYFDAGYGIDTAMGGGYYFIGTTKSYTGSIDKQMFFIKTDSDGNLLSVENHGGSNDEEGRFVKELANGDRVIGGMSESFGNGGKSLFMLHFYPGSNGGANWGGTDDDEGYSMALGKDSQFVFVGITNSYGAGLNDIYLIRIDSFIFVGDYKFSLQEYNDSLVSIKELVLEEQKYFNISPNPSTQFAEVKLVNGVNEKGKCILKITDLTGHEIKEFPINLRSIILARTDFPYNGIYFISLYIDDQLSATQKLIFY